MLVQMMDRAINSGLNGRALQALNDLGTNRRVSNEVLNGGIRMRQMQRSSLNDRADAAMG